MNAKKETTCQTIAAIPGIRDILRRDIINEVQEESFQLALKLGRWPQLAKFDRDCPKGFQDSVDTVSVARELRDIAVQVNRLKHFRESGAESNKAFPQFTDFSVVLGRVVLNLFDLAGVVGAPLGDVITALLKLERTGG